MPNHKHRTAMISRFIEIAQALQDIGNYNGLMEVREKRGEPETQLICVLSGDLWFEPARGPAAETVLEGSRCEALTVVHSDERVYGPEVQLADVPRESLVSLVSSPTLPRPPPYRSDVY